MILLFFLIWIVLNGKVTAEIILFGIVFAAAAAAFSWKVFGYNPRWDLRLLRNLPLLAAYSFTLIVEIVKAAFLVMSVALRPGAKPDPYLCEFHSGLTTDMQNVLLANSITLTPGTYTLFQEGDHFVVHCLRKEYSDGIEESSFVKLLGKMNFEDT